jgi:hypothetical protein
VPTRPENDYAGEDRLQFTGLNWAYIREVPIQISAYCNYLWFSPVPPEKFRDSTSIKSRSLLFRSFPKHCYFILEASYIPSSPQGNKQTLYPVQFQLNSVHILRDHCFTSHISTVPQCAFRSPNWPLCSRLHN